MRRSALAAGSFAGIVNPIAQPARSVVYV